MSKKDDTLRDTLLGSAKNIADTEGIEAINIRSIARKAGIASGTVYNYFSNKEKILLALTEAYWNQALLEMKSKITADPNSKRIERRKSQWLNDTNLSVMHTHYFLLGMFFFFVLMLTEKVFSFSDQKTGRLLAVYQLGLNITGLGFLLRGLTQVWGTELSRRLDASISGIAGIGHILTGVCIILLLLKIKKKVD